MSNDVTEADTSRQYSNGSTGVCERYAYAQAGSCDMFCCVLNSVNIVLLTATA